MRSFRAHPSALRDIREFVRQLAEIEHVRIDAADDLLLAVTEACANAIVHTNTDSVEVTCRFSPHAVEIQVHDNGVFRRQVPLPEMGGSGRGIPLMIAVMDEVTIREGNPGQPGTLVRLVKLTHTAAAAGSDSG
jgi:anti-sigma regulatory factor (Ser/Thr protein kinase)